MQWLLDAHAQLVTLKPSIIKAFGNVGVLRAWETDYKRAALRDITRVFPCSYEVVDVVDAATGSAEPFLADEQDDWHDNVPVTLLP